MPTHDPAIVHTEPADISELVAVIWDAIADAEGDINPAYLKHHLDKAGLLVIYTGKQP